MEKLLSKIAKKSGSECFLSSQNIWEHQTALPSPLLAGKVYRYEGYITQTKQPLYYLGVARDHLVLVLGCGNPMEVYQIEQQSQSRNYQSILVGINTKPLIAKFKGTRLCIEIRMHPSITFGILAKNPIDLAVGPIDLEKIWHNDLCYLTQRIEKSSSWQERFDCLNDYFLHKLNTTQDKIPPKIQWAWNQIQSQYGNISIRKLVQQVGWSHRYFNQCFREYIGITPKLAARRIRFVRAHQLLTQNHCDLSSVAATCNYSDQSHFTRDFHQFSGCSPANYQNLTLANASYFPVSIFSEKVNSFLINPRVNN